MSILQNDNSELENLFINKLTENGDKSFSSTGNKMLNVLFMTEYYSKHLEETPFLGNDETAKLFAMFIRDPRAGLGKRDLGRRLLADSLCNYDQILKCGRADDLWMIFKNTKEWHHVLDVIKKAIDNKADNAELLKKWLPRYASKNLMIAREIAAYWGMNKQQYGHYVKCDTVENTMSRTKWDQIKFEYVPSLAAVKYAKAFQRHQPERYSQYLEDVRSGKKQLHVSTTNVYDIYRNRYSIDTDLFFSKLEKIQGNWIPIVDTSGSMQDANDSIGKALSVGHYLAKCSTYCPNQVISFSSHPQLITLGQTPCVLDGFFKRIQENTSSQYLKEINSMITGDCSNTDFGAVMKLIRGLKTEFPEWLIVLSD